jgi:hypothetical protein
MLFILAFSSDIETRFLFLFNFISYLFFKLVSYFFLLLYSQA